MALDDNPFFILKINIMIYKFNEDMDEHGTLEVSHDDGLILDITHRDGTEIVLSFDRDQLYDLIGALHSIQTKLNNHYKDKKNG